MHDPTKMPVEMWAVRMLSDKQFEAHNKIVRQAVEAEREACATLADLQAALDRRNAERHRDTDNSFEDCAITAESVARAIRFRSTLETAT